MRGEDGGVGQSHILENKSEDNITLTATRVRESFQAIYSLRSSELRSLSPDISAKFISLGMGKQFHQHHLPTKQEKMKNSFDVSIISVTKGCKKRKI